MVQPGQILAGKFQIERVLGEGGMGVVVAAHHLQLGQLVALKFLHREALQNATVTERFLREARAIVKLKSEHVGRVIDVGTLEDGAPYIVMEYLDGCDLQQFLVQHTRLPIGQAVDFVLQASEAVAEAHSLGIIHRDLKPANMFLTTSADGVAMVKVLDFGISKATGDSEDFSLTRTATVMGSPGYMSPEQLRSARDVDVRTDVWALGVILYELVTGVAPFAAETITELTLKVAMDPVPPMPAAVPPAFAEVVTRCLAKDPAQRYGSIAELAAALVPFGGPGAHQQAQRIARVQAGLATNLLRSGVLPVATSPTTLSATASASNTSAAAGKRTGILIGAGVAAVAIVVAVVIAMSGGKGGGATGAARSPEPGSAAGSTTGSAVGSAATPGSGSDQAAGSGSDQAAGSGSDQAAGSGSDMAAGSAAGSGSGSDVAAGSGSDMAAGSGSDMAAGSGSGSGSDMGSGSGSSRRGGHRRGSGSAGSGAEDFSNSRH